MTCIFARRIGEVGGVIVGVSITVAGAGVEETTAERVLLRPAFERGVVVTKKQAKWMLSSKDFRYLHIVGTEEYFGKSIRLAVGLRHNVNCILTRCQSPTDTIIESW